MAELALVDGVGGENPVASYRGYKLVFVADTSSWQVFRGGKLLCTQASEELALRWIDRQLKNEDPEPVS